MEKCPKCGVLLEVIECCGGGIYRCDVCGEGKVYDVWITFGSMHEVRAFRERKKRSVWFRELVESCVVYGDRGYSR